MIDDGPSKGPTVSMSEQDTSDRDEKLRQAQQEEEMRVLNRSGEAVKLGLPRPIGVDMTTLEVLDPEIAHAQELVNAELVKLVHHDSVEYPLLGTTRAARRRL